jgi:hypothetical protein
MKKFLLTVIGDFQSEELCQEIALSISPIVDSAHLKYQHTKGILIFHFASEVTREEIHDYMVGILYGITDTFILSEFTDNMSVAMPEDLRSHLFDLDNSDDNVSMKLDMNRIRNNSDFMEEEDDFVALLLGESNEFIKKPSLDAILDKINSKGYESLTQFEKDILENYSKN